MDVANFTQNYDTVFLDYPSSNYSYQWYYCTNGQTITPIPQATSSGLHSDTSAMYVLVVNNGYCSDTTTCISFDFSGVDNFHKTGIRVYPNPSTGIFYIENNTSNNYTLIVRNSLGQLVKNEQVTTTNYTLSLDEFSSGIYFLQINDYVEKLIVK